MLVLRLALPDPPFTSFFTSVLGSGLWLGNCTVPLEVRKPLQFVLEFRSLLLKSMHLAGE